MGLDPKEYEICLVCGILGQVGESNIAFVLSETFGGLEYCIGESMDSISGILNDEEIEQLKLFYQLEEGDNDLRDQMIDHLKSVYMSFLHLVSLNLSSRLNQGLYFLSKVFDKKIQSRLTKNM